MRKKLHIILAIALLFAISAPIASASISDLEITHTGVEKVAPGAEAKFKLTLYNGGSERLTLDINKDPFTTLPDSWFDYILIEPNRIELNAKERKNVLVTMKFKRTVQTDSSYSTFVRVMPIGKPEETVKHDFIVRIVPPEDILSIDIDAPSLAKPGRDYEFSLNMVNNLNMLLSEVEVFVSSELFEEKKSFKVLPLQERTESFTVKIPDAAKPGKQTLNVRIYYDQQLAGKESFDFHVSTTSEVGFKTESGESFLKRWVKATKTNVGNAPAEEKYDVQLSAFQRMFSSYEPEPTYTDSFGAHWEFVLEPNTEHAITATINYRPLFWILVVLVSFGVFAYCMLTMGVFVRKEILEMKTNKEGVTELRLMLHVKNNTSRELKHASLIEVLPHHIHPKTHFDTLKPDKVQKGAAGIRLMWDIPEIAKREERLLTYNIETKVGVLGKVTLPPAMLRYKTKSGKVTSTRSNRLEFFSGPQEPKKKHK